MSNLYRLNLSADYGQWPFRNGAHSMTAAQRAWIAATRTEHAEEDEDDDAPLSADELNELIHGAR